MPPLHLQEACPCNCAIRVPSVQLCICNVHINGWRNAQFLSACLPFCCVMQWEWSLNACSSQEYWQHSCSQQGANNLPTAIDDIYINFIRSAIRMTFCTEKVLLVRLRSLCIQVMRCLKQIYSTCSMMPVSTAFAHCKPRYLCAHNTECDHYERFTSIR